MLDLTPSWEQIEFTAAPPDMWNRQKDSGKSMAELFMENGVGIIRASNNRVQGWMAVKEMLKPLNSEKDRPGPAGDAGLQGALHESSGHPARRQKPVGLCHGTP